VDDGDDFGLIEMINENGVKSAVVIRTPRYNPQLLMVSLV
jgi:hypothetical protein